MEGQEEADGTWLDAPDPLRAVMLQQPASGAFVRCLLPVHLTDGYRVTFGVWVGLHPLDLQRAAREWNAPSYPDLVLDGRLGNLLPVWGLLDAPVRATVLNPDETPYVTSSSDSALAELLTREWPHDQVLDALPS